jgi:hypothetical protein
VRPQRRQPRPLAARRPALELGVLGGTPSGLALHIERVLHAPRPVVFNACIDPEELATWWGPAGFTSPSIEIDPRVGGSYRIAMQPPGRRPLLPEGRVSRGRSPESPRLHVRVGGADARRPGNGRHPLVRRSRAGHRARPRPGPVRDRRSACSARSRLDGRARAPRGVAALTTGLTRLRESRFRARLPACNRL